MPSQELNPSSEMKRLGEDRIINRGFVVTPSSIVSVAIFPGTALFVEGNLSTAESFFSSLRTFYIKSFIFHSKSLKNLSGQAI